MFESRIYNISMGGVPREEKKEFWLKFINAKDHQLSERDWHAVRHLAADWDTCACGSLDDGISRGPTGYPEDLALRTLGHAFYEHIKEHELKAAQQEFIAIQERGAQLLKSTLFGDTNV